MRRGQGRGKWLEETPNGYWVEIELFLTIRALEFYSGIGGLHLSLKRSNVPASILQAFDWDQNACRVYAANYGNDIAKKVDISLLSADVLVPYGANLWILSPSCQPYTVLNPNAKGAQDPRAKSFLHLVQVVLPELVAKKKHPTHILVENVAGFESSSTRETLLSGLKSMGYATAEFLLTPLQFGIPNSRLRYYLLAKFPPSAFPQFGDDPTTPYRYIPSSSGKSRWTDPRLTSDNAEKDASDESIYKLQRYLDDNGLDNDEPSPYGVPDKVLQKWGRLFDIVLPSSRRTCCFTRGYTRLVERAGSIVQMNTDLDTTATFDLFLKAQEENDPEAVNILHPLRLRYFSSSELLRLFAFDRCEVDQTMPSQNNDSVWQNGFVWPEGITEKTKYRLIGNSVNVRVVTELINFLYED
ncbi:S-adenosyl-L-methionine-dependent methyltransferase [Dendrothele bispora CBS 962.96]|uniref:tRNA (cytosine(38)-C(5))-methyltransferase n=1 Tax=Dendrothele bispora (strain CBS 962.96) TaxID=1314807 RepID=A0A4S8LGI7_DENBC|nr:S-adenosyl-L-methionine-dependent methyltransferase [Dendrothele bispora CBS 962.96]